MANHRNRQLLNCCRPQKFLPHGRIAERPLPHGEFSTSSRFGDSGRSTVSRGGAPGATAQQQGAAAGVLPLAQRGSLAAGISNTGPLETAMPAEARPFALALLTAKLDELGRALKRLRRGCVCTHMFVSEHLAAARGWRESSLGETMANWVREISAGPPSTYRRPRPRRLCRRRQQTAWSPAATSDRRPSRRSLRRVAPAERAQVKIAACGRRSRPA
jgi:hypothetical protein